ncbi:hypothetical protein ACKAV7_011489 [Fusarium commune]|nr:hypothetical protein LZL87_009872 [Fusarium oxysporum]
MKITAFLASAFVGAATAADTLYLVNSWKGNEISSGMAYYADGHEPSDGPRPDDYVDVTHGSHVIWEGQPVKGKSFESLEKAAVDWQLGTFGTGVSFTSNIFADAASKHDNAWAGTGTNGYHTYNCWKRTGPVGKPVVLYTVDGWTVETVYYCRPFN